MNAVLVYVYSMDVDVATVCRYTMSINYDRYTSLCVKGRSFWCIHAIFTICVQLSECIKEIYIACKVLQHIYIFIEFYMWYRWSDRLENFILLLSTVIPSSISHIVLLSEITKMNIVCCAISSTFLNIFSEFEFVICSISQILQVLYIMTSYIHDYTMWSQVCMCLTVTK